MNKLKEDNRHLFTPDMCNYILHSIPKLAMQSTIDDIKRIDMLKWLHKVEDFEAILDFSNEMGRKFLIENKPNVWKTLKYLLTVFIPQHID